MKKIDRLRDAMTLALRPHDVANNPDRLEIRAVTGSVHASGRLVAAEGPAGGFEHRYTAVMGVFDFPGDVDEILIPVLLWAQRWQPELLAANGGAGIAWESEPLDQKSRDYLVRLPLTERVTFVPRPGQPGQFDVVYLDDPARPDLLDAPPLHALYLDDELFLHCAAHPDGSSFDLSNPANSSLIGTF